jgi:hypothetical protein
MSSRCRSDVASTSGASTWANQAYLSPRRWWPRHRCTPPAALQHHNGFTVSSQLVERVSCQDGERAWVGTKRSLAGRPISMRQRCGCSWARSRLPQVAVGRRGLRRRAYIWGDAVLPVRQVPARRTKRRCHRPENDRLHLPCTSCLLRRVADEASPLAVGDGITPLASTLEARGRDQVSRSHSRSGEAPW